MRAKQAKGGKNVGSVRTGKVYENKGTVLRGTKTRTFVPAKPKVSTSFNEIGERTVHFHNESQRTVMFNGKAYKVNRNIAG